MRLHSLAKVMGPPVNAVMRRSERRRRPDLGELTHDAGFRALNARVAWWVDENLRLIETAAPWLSRVGGTVLDHCMTGAWPQGVMHRGTFHVTCRRSVVSVYGFAGALDAGLAQLQEVLANVGWMAATTRRRPPDRIALAGNDPPAHGQWHPVERPGPQGQKAGGPERVDPPIERPDVWASIEVAWGSNGWQAGAAAAAALAVPGAEPERATDFYHPVQVCQAPELITEALTWHANVVAIRISLDYYRQSAGLPQVKRG